MNLDRSTVEGWLQVAHPDPTVHDDRRERIVARLDDPEFTARRFVAVTDDVVRAVAWLFDTQPGRFGVSPPRTRGDRPIETTDAALLDEALATAWALGAEGVGLRLPTDRQTPAMLEAIERTRGREAGGRVEFKTPLAELAPRDDPALVWRPADAQAPSLYERCSLGSDDGLEPDDDAAEVLASYDAPNDLNADVHIGALDGSDVALVCTQVAPSDGWSTICFMGLVPEARGQGLGPALQGHGISMMKVRGGVLYHGGTSLHNAAMRACFARNDIREWRRFRQFRWAPPTE